MVRVDTQNYLQTQQVRSFLLVSFISLVVIVTISILSPQFSLSILLGYYDYKIFLGFSILVYVINILIYHFSLKRILGRPTIDLIRTI